MEQVPALRKAMGKDDRTEARRRRKRKGTIKYMNLTGFNDQQKQTLLDLLVIGMYADGNLGGRRGCED